MGKSTASVSHPFILSYKYSFSPSFAQEGNALAMKQALPPEPSHYLGTWPRTGSHRCFFLHGQAQNGCLDRFERATPSAHPRDPRTSSEVSQSCVALPHPPQTPATSETPAWHVPCPSVCISIKSVKMGQDTYISLIIPSLAFSGVASRQPFLALEALIVH